jgi:hypothetical protein
MLQQQARPIRIRSGWQSIRISSGGQSGSHFDGLWAQGLSERGAGGVSSEEEDAPAAQQQQSEHCVQAEGVSSGKEVGASVAVDEADLVSVLVEEHHLVVEE